MKIETLRRLRGPNVYLSRPAMVARLRLAELTGQETCDVTGFTERLLRALPGLAEHHCAAGAPRGSSAGSATAPTSGTSPSTSASNSPS